MALNGLFCADVPLRNYSLTFGWEAQPLKIWEGKNSVQMRTLSILTANILAFQL